MPFIYTLIDPTTNEIRYVGKANNPERRLSSHIYQHSDASNPHKHNWIKKLRRQGLRPIMQIVEICADSEWKQREKYWIAKYRKSNHKLLNISAGGDDGGKSDEGRERLRTFGIIRFARRKGLKLYRCFSCGGPTVSQAKLCKHCASELSKGGNGDAVKYYLNSYRDEHQKNRRRDRRITYYPDMDIFPGEVYPDFLNKHLDGVG